MDVRPDSRIGRNAMLLALLGNEKLEPEFIKDLRLQGYIYCQGKTGSMETQKVVAAIETAARQNQVIEKDLYRETHALYHAIMEALHGVTRGQVLLGTVLRTVGLSFAVIRGKPYSSEEEGEWVAVALYGTIGAPVKGSEHEAIGLGINHI
ncbi:MAG: hut operon transcriptional regulator HutP [Bacillota bacterium]|uniref:Hut operon positive regulatory protein n=1 Tax=Cytobacillus oceanisediminis 2691 TaxID=1196031 RepID=A0A160MHM8_9BACI|nr:MULTISPECIES: hut operon transcriptional regulator HutP [Bacillaceae]AND42969.1 anti-terminator HutP [Cytobacillus oceanisediminis 2691]MBN8202773.1 hut operon transcriptional regulator HutP [Bacillus sp. NTK034]MCM3244656.1 hut operon transcriptional regulator HutP [Cytobacillus oceanisediminis]USK47489.1 hut operon transcriptional regulator HutP [Cytobacillus oceanisediminis]